MNTTAKVIIGVLAALSVGLAIALTVSLTTGGDDNGMGISANGNHYMGMMQAIGRMDANGVTEHMKAILGDQGYHQMLQHMADHRDGTAGTNDTTTNDGMMHQMMDGFLQQMPGNGNYMMPGGPKS